MRLRGNCALRQILEPALLFVRRHCALSDCAGSTDAAIPSETCLQDILFHQAHSIVSETLCTADHSPAMGYFNVRKAAQVVAYFVHRRGGRASIIDAMELAYLADRESLRLYDRPIIDDDFCVTNFGLVDATTYDFAKGARQDREAWERYLTKHGETLVSPPLADNDLDELSEREADLLRSVYSRFEEVRDFALADWVQDNCKEWSQPDEAPKNLPYQEVLGALGKKNSEKIADTILEHRKLKEEIAKLQ
jgi:hypothetical protein